MKTPLNLLTEATPRRMSPGPKQVIALMTATLFAGVTATAAPFEWTGASGIDWATPANWSPSGPPGLADDARFFDAGAVFDAVTIDNNVTADTTVQLLWLGQTNGIHNTQINAGVTLTVSNAATDGSRLLIAGTETAVTATTIVSNTVSGDGTLVIAGSTNIDASVNQQNILGSISVSQKHGSGGNHWATLDMRNLAHFSATAALFRIGWSDTTLRRGQGYVILAKTNHITVAGGDGEAGISVGDNRGNNNNNSGFSVLWLGQENVINANTVRFGSQKSQGRLFFTPGLVSPNFTLRGMDGTGRTEIFAVGDNHQQGASGNPCAGTVDVSDGSVDLLVDTMYVARGQTSTGRESVADVTFGAGLVDVNTLEVAYQSAPNAASGANNRVDGDLTLNGTTLRVNSILHLGRWGGSPDGWILARMFVTNGATLMAQAISSEIVNADSVGSLTLDNSTLIVTNTATGLSSLSLADSLFRTVAIGNSVVVETAALTTGGAGNTIQIGRLPGILSYPAQFRLIDYDGAIGGAGFNFTMTGLNVAYTGYLSNNTVDGSIDLVLTSGPVAQSLTWSGSPNGVWNTGNLNWRAGAIPTNYSDGDFPVFDDSATGTTTVDVSTALFPGEVTFDNNTKTYTLTGSGAIAGLASVVKDGSGSLIVQNNNSYLGTSAISNGTVQIGNGGTTGTLGSGGIINNGALVFERSDDFEMANSISGSAAGSIAKHQANTLTLSGNNSYSGDITVTAGTLRAGSGTALGDAVGVTTLSAGTTLDVNGQSLGAESVTTSSTGVGGAGAIVNLGDDQLSALRYVTLTGNTTFGGTGRWDIRAPGGTTGDPAGAALSTGGNGYTLTKAGANQVNIVSTTIDPALGDITIEEGILGFEGNITSVGNPASTLIVKTNTTLRFWAVTNLFNKTIVIEDGGSIVNGSGDSTVIGPATLNGVTTIDVGGNSLTLSNAIAGGGSIVKQNNATLILAGPADTYTGDTTVSNGTLLVNGPNTGGGSLIMAAGTTLGGTSTFSGPVSMAGSLQPGAANVAGTIGTGDLTLEVGATATFDLSTNLTIGGGVNDLVNVNGNLIANGNSITLNLYQLKLSAGTYRLINYTGSLIGNLNTNIDLGGASRYGLTLDTNTVGQVNLVVTGGPDDLIWASTASPTWDIGFSSNWFNSTLTAQDAFFQGDNVLLDDTAGLVTSIDLAGAVAPATLTVDSTNNFYALNGPGKITGGGSVVKRGDSTLTLNSTNDFTGPVVIRKGIVQLGNNSALGSTFGSTIISNGATLDIGVPTLAANQVNLGAEPIVVSGAGSSGLGAIVNNTIVNQQNAVRDVTLTGDTVLGGLGRWDIRGTGASLSTGGNAYNVIKTGNNQISFVGVAVDPAFGNVDVQQGTLSFETSSTAGDPSKTFAAQGGAILQFFNLSQPLDKRIALTNSSIHNDSGNNTLIGPIIMDGFCTIDVDGGSSITTSNTLTGNSALNKNGTGALSLSSAGFVGDTTINAGTLSLLGSASLAGSVNLNVNAGGLDVSGRVDGRLNLTGAQILSGNGTVTGDLVAAAGSTIAPGAGYIGRLTVSGSATLDGTITMELDKLNATNDVLNAGSLQYGGTLQLINYSDPYGAGNTFKLFNAASYAGTFTAINPVTPGTGLAWDTTNLASNGTLKVVSTTPLPPPNIVTFTYAGGNVTLNGNNGPAYGTYQVLTTTDLSQPVANWTVLATNYFDVSGNFSLNLTVNANDSQRYFIVRLP